MKRTMFVIYAFFSGLMFGLGLMVSGMANPAKVLVFLDIGGAWDPSLALVMGGAIAVAFPAFRLARKRSLSLTREPIKLPSATRIDVRLLGGSAIFGAGWGLAGFCPGPSLVALGMGEPKALAFVIAMLVGMLGFELLEKAGRTKNRKLKPDQSAKV